MAVIVEGDIVDARLLEACDRRDHRAARIQIRMGGAENAAQLADATESPLHVPGIGAYPLRRRLVEAGFDDAGRRAERLQVGALVPRTAGLRLVDATKIVRRRVDLPVGELELEFTPQGTLAEKLRAGGSGIPAFFTKTGLGTIVAEGKEVREFDGKKYVMERSLTADLGLVKAWKGDKAGNLIYRKTARNFNPMVAMAGRITVAEVEILVETGELDADQIHTPGIFVQRIVHNPHPEKRIEQRTTRKD